jgi:hypothetical protein
MKGLGQAKCPNPVWHSNLLLLRLKLPHPGVGIWASMIAFKTSACGFLCLPPVPKPSLALTVTY